MSRPPLTRRWVAATERYGVRLAAAALGLAAVAVPFSLLALLIAAKWSPLLHLDLAVERRVHGWTLSADWLRHLAFGLTAFGETSVRFGLAGVAALVLLARRAYRSATYLTFTVALGGLANTLTKAAVSRARPVLPEPITSAHGTSFPSGHAMGAMIAYGAMLLVLLPYLGRRGRRIARVLAAALIAGVGVSRVVLGVHYPSDVVGGWLLGFGWLVTSAALFNLWRREAGRPTGPPGPSVVRRPG